MSKRFLGGLALLALYLLHQDLWLWHQGRLVFGLPVGLVYHLGYCLAAAALMAWWARLLLAGEETEAR